MLIKNWLNQKRAGLVYRWRNFRYGIFFIKASNYKIPTKLWIRNKLRSFRFSFTNKEFFFYEFRQICIEDCYRLDIIKRNIPVKTIVDIGANQGLFVLAARKKFPNSLIHAYEPNPQLENRLRHNAAVCKAEVFMEAVSDEDGYMTLKFGETDLQTEAIKSLNGDIVTTSFEKVKKRLNDNIDLLKMDCEGGEWALLEQLDLLTNVRSITMEYHLWAKKGSSFQDIQEVFKKLNFEILSHNPLSETFGIITAIKTDKDRVL